MLLMHEELARARMSQRRHEAQRASLAARLASARRWQRRAESANRRARLALAAVS
jgi:hypothetical protein